MRFAWIVVAAVAGCSAPPAGPEEADVDEVLEAWVKASLRAHDTRTHATGEHPVAQAEAERRMDRLKASPKAGVTSAIARRRAGLKSRRETADSARASIMVVGRPLTKDEERECDRLSGEIGRIDLEDGLLQSLASGLGEPGDGPRR